MERKDLFRLMAEKAIEVTNNHPEVEVSIMDNSHLTGRFSFFISASQETYKSIFVSLKDDMEKANAHLDTAEEVVAEVIRIEEERKMSAEEKLEKANEKIAELEAKLKVLTNNPRAAV